jgi:uncharacterized repeat protein (TIGR03803 family)
MIAHSLEKNRRLLFVLLVFSVASLYCQEFTNLYNFRDTDGASPFAALSFSGSTLYGTTSLRGSFDQGTVFAMSTDGVSFQTIHTFSAVNNETNADGSYPVAPVLVSGQTLYGTASGGGSSGNGTVFAVKGDSSGFTNLHNFTSIDGTSPAGLTLSSGILYGIAQEGGTSQKGTIFKVSTNGGDFSILHNFHGTDDGVNPSGCLVISGTRLYGVAAYGGMNGNGTVFAMNTDGSGFVRLHDFSTTSGGPFYTNYDGINPFAALTLSGDTLYGTASYGGDYGNGTIFTVCTNGTNFSVLHSFSTLQNEPSTGLATNNDGGGPTGLVLSGNILYGTTGFGGNRANGTVFQVNTNGTHFATLHSFTQNNNAYGTNSDGADPIGGVVLSNGALYGTANFGGVFGNGTIFRISVRPTLITQMVGTNLLLTWQSNFSGFNLESTTNLTLPMWTNVSPSPVIVSGRNTVTNQILGGQRFYRLSQ